MRLLHLVATENPQKLLNQELQLNLGSKSLTHKLRQCFTLLLLQVVSVRSKLCCFESTETIADLVPLPSLQNPASIFNKTKKKKRLEHNKSFALFPVSFVVFLVLPLRYQVLMASELVYTQTSYHNVQKTKKNQLDLHQNQSLSSLIFQVRGTRNRSIPLEWGGRNQVTVLGLLFHELQILEFDPV